MNAHVNRYGLVSICIVAGLSRTTTVVSADSAPQCAGPQSRYCSGSVEQSRAFAAYARTPMAFETNRREAQDGFDFVTRGLGYMLGLSAGEAVLSLSRPAPRFPRNSAIQQSASDVLRMRIVGGDVRARGVAEGALPGVVNYCVGDRQAWRTGIRTYQRVRYSDVYPGVDLVYYGSQRELEYDFVVSPGADLSRIAIAFEGAHAPEIDGGGCLIVRTGAGTVRLRKPVIYQLGASGRMPVDGGYVLGPAGRVAFRIGEYDHNRELVIDPILSYSTYFGGGRGLIGDCPGDIDRPLDIAVGPLGMITLVGQTNSMTLPGSAEEHIVCTEFPGFVTRLNATGQAALVTTFVGTSTVFNALAVNEFGDAFVAGADSGDACVAKIRNSDGVVLWQTEIGGSESDVATCLALAPAFLWVAGTTSSPDFPARFDLFDNTHNGATDAFVGRLDLGGQDFGMTFIGGSGADTATGVAVDGDGNAYVTGNTRSDDMPVTPGAYDETYNGGNVGDAWVAKFLPLADALGYCTYLGGTGTDLANDIGILPGGAEVYVAGGTQRVSGAGEVPFPTTPGAFQTESAGGIGDAFVTRMTAQGDGLVYSTLLGGSGVETVVGIEVDRWGTAYVVGETTSHDFPIVWPDPVSLDGNNRIFVSKIASPGHELIWSTMLGGTGFNNPEGIDVDHTGAVYVTGWTLPDSGFPLVNPLMSSTPMDGGNTVDGFVFVMGMPEAMMSDVNISPAEAATGEPITVSVNVTNIGSVGLENVSATIGFNFSGDPGMVTSGDPAPTTIPSLAPGESQTVVQEFVSADPGVLSFFFDVDGTANGAPVSAHPAGCVTGSTMGGDCNVLVAKRKLRLEVLRMEPAPTVKCGQTSFLAEGVLPTVAFGYWLGGMFHCESGGVNIEVRVTSADTGHTLENALVTFQSPALTGLPQIVTPESEGRGYFCSPIRDLRSNCASGEQALQVQTDAEGKASVIYWVPGVIEDVTARINILAQDIGFASDSTNREFTIKPNSVFPRHGDSDATFIFNDFDTTFVRGVGVVLIGTGIAEIPNKLCEWFKMLLFPQIPRVDIPAIAALEEQTVIGELCMSITDGTAPVAVVKNLSEMAVLAWFLQKSKLDGVGLVAPSTDMFGRPKAEVKSGLAKEIIALIGEINAKSEYALAAGARINFRLYEVSNMPFPWGGTKNALYLKLRFSGINTNNGKEVIIDKGVIITEGYEPNFFLQERPTTTMTGGAVAGGTVLEVASNDGFSPGDDIVINRGGESEEGNTIAALGSLILERPLQFDHAPGETVTLLSFEPAELGDPDEVTVPLNSAGGGCGPGTALAMPMMLIGMGWLKSLRRKRR